MSSSEIAEQDAARRDLDKAIDRTEKVRQQMLQAVVRARRAKIPVPEIAARVGVTRATIYTWLKDAEGPDS